MIGTCITLSDKSNENPITNSNWFNQNRLSLNNEKTVGIIFSEQITQNESKLKLNEHILNFVASTKDFGLVLDNKLSFSIHIDYICNKKSKSIDYLLVLHCSF